MANPFEEAIKKALQSSGQESSSVRVVDTDSLKATSKSGK